jgi:hypothetical protein
MNNSPLNADDAPTWLDRLGNWNPQLLREIRGRLKRRNLIVAVSLSLLFQLLLVLFYSQRLPGNDCYIQSGSFGCAASWTEWWLEQFRFLTWTAPFLLFLAGIYSIVADLSLEDYKGTLNFIRISPRSSVSILLGKVMGVPLLAYISLGLTIPYHLVAAIKGDVPIAFLISFYVLLICTGFLLFSASLLIALLSGWKAKFGGQVSAGALIFAFISFIWISPAFMWWNIFTSWSAYSGLLLGRNAPPLATEWWYLPIANNIWFAHLFNIGNLLVFSFAIWQILERRFHNPTATIAGKGQSYAITAYVEILMLGFCVQSWVNQNNTNKYELQLIMLLILYIVNSFIFLSAISALTPTRQALLDWVRFGALSNTEGHPSGWLYILRDLIWSDKSPATLAILLNLLFTHLPILIWINSWQNSVAQQKALIVISSFVLTTLLISLIDQLIMFLKTRNPNTWATGAILGLVLLPSLIMLSLSISPDRYGSFWLFFGYPWAILTNIKQADLIRGFTAQILVIIALSLQFVHRLQRANNSIS